MTYPIIIHGSENSLDRDAYIILPEPLSFKEAKKLCDSYKDINANLLVITNGQVSWCYKGTKDECNNSILATYNLHDQEYPSPVTIPAERGYGLKMLRTVRGLLSYVSRTNLRVEVKKALVSDDLNFKMEVLKKINLNTITDFEKSTPIETYKFYAFQMGQTLALLEENVELFTKNSVAKKYPNLAPYLERKETSPEELQLFLNRLSEFIEKSYSQVYKQPLYMTNFHGIKEILDCKKEIVMPPVVVFDIDGTLMDETHRSHLRETKNWEEYFDLCHLDTPINHIVQLARDYKEQGYEVWLMSGRAVSCEAKTRQSMEEHGVPFDRLKLRSKDVFIPDYVLKPAWIGKYIGHERVEMIFDDTDKVIEGFRAKGLPVTDVKQLGLNKTIKPHFK
jgi:hypothetical protein